MSNFLHIDDLIIRYPVLDVCHKDIVSAYEILENCFKNVNKLLVAGNGGSAADALHIVGELMKSFVLSRKLSHELCKAIDNNCEHADYLKDNLQMALPAIALVGEIGLTTAYSNDVAPDLAFAQQVLGYGNTGDVFLGISTSGNSQNIIYAAELAKAKGMYVVGLTGKSGGKLKDLCDVCIKVPEKDTFKVQELHLPVYHALCLELEREFYGE
ncbi:MAG: SIS domain-containing protein [Phascolarctobacterium sp.]|nr:SIS domain-containing protein [Phascolarctobacterium sp.]